MAVAALQCRLCDCNGSGGAVMIGMQWQWLCCEEVAVASGGTAINRSIDRSDAEKFLSDAKKILSDAKKNSKPKPNPNNSSSTSFYLRVCVRCVIPWLEVR